MKALRIAALAVAGLAASLAGWHLTTRAVATTAKAAISAGDAIPVTAGTALFKDVPLYVRGLGTVQAFKTVAVKTRVDGQIMQVAFAEGQEVKAGDPLFQIDPRPFQAQLDQAMAAKQKDQAQLSGAQLDLERYGKLLGNGFQTRQSYDQQKAQVEQLRASIKSDQAQIDSARLNLTYADIRAPIDGRTGARLVDPGNLVQAGQGVSLVSITQVKPTFVSFNAPQDQVDAIRRGQAQQPLAVIAYASDDRTVLSEGHLSLIDNQIDIATGTIRLKAIFENRDERLWPGEYVSARLILGTRKGSVTVPADAVQQGAGGYYGYVIKPDSTVERRALRLGPTQDGFAVVEQGLAAGERIVVEGQYRLVDGARIKAEGAATPAG